MVAHQGRVHTGFRFCNQTASSSQEQSVKQNNLEDHLQQSMNWKTHDFGGETKIALFVWVPNDTLSYMYKINLAFESDKRKPCTTYIFVMQHYNETLQSVNTWKHTKKAQLTEHMDAHTHMPVDTHTHTQHRAINESSPTPGCWLTCTDPI